MIDGLAQALTESIRQELCNCADDPEIRRRLTAPGLAALRRMSRELTVDDSMELVFPKGDEHWWKDWYTGSSRADPVPIEERVKLALQAEIEQVLAAVS